MASVVGLTSACSAPQQIQYEEDLERATASERHAIHDERLQQLMRSLDRLSNERLPKSMDVESERRFRANEVAAAAMALSDSALRIPEVSNHGRLGPAASAEFEGLAEALRERANALARDAPALSIENMHARLAEIDLICRVCHERFRLGGPR